MKLKYKMTRFHKKVAIIHMSILRRTSNKYKNCKLKETNKKWATLVQ
jgi:hypothetical protein